jgi:hypothetical protein
MIVHKLRWLSLLSLIGVAGWFTGNYGFYGFFGFLGFLAFHRLDERDSALAGQAALVAFGVTIILAALGIAAVPILLVYREALSWNMGDVLACAFIALAAIMFFCPVSFAVSYAYLDRKGESL